MKKPEIIEMLELASNFDTNAKIACDEYDKAAWELLSKHGYDHKKPKLTKARMIRDGVGLVECYSYQNENVYLWWELHKFDGDKEGELIDKSRTINTRFRVN